jgi:hypothetical protein
MKLTQGIEYDLNWLDSSLIGLYTYHSVKRIFLSTDFTFIGPRTIVIELGIRKYFNIAFLTEHSTKIPINWNQFFSYFSVLETLVLNHVTLSVEDCHCQPINEIKYVIFKIYIDNHQELLTCCACSRKLTHGIYCCRNVRISCGRDCRNCFGNNYEFY